MTLKNIDYEIEYQEQPNPQDSAVLFNGLNEQAFVKKQIDHMRPLGLFIRDKEGSVLCGLTALTYYGCLYISMLWVNDSLRGKGIGTRLMLQAEQVALERGCTFSTVATMDWEALEFYQKLGYEIEFIRQGYVKSSTMFMLRKQLK